MIIPKFLSFYKSSKTKDFGFKPRYYKRKQTTSQEQGEKHLNFKHALRKHKLKKGEIISLKNFEKYSFIFSSTV